VKHVQTKEITGDQNVNGITYVDRETGEEQHVELQGVFVKIDLVPNTEWLDGSVERNRTAKSQSIHAAKQASPAYSRPATAQTARTTKSLFRWDRGQMPH